MPEKTMTFWGGTRHEAEQFAAVWVEQNPDVALVMIHSTPVSEARIDAPPREVWITQVRYRPE